MGLILPSDPGRVKLRRFVEQAPDKISSHQSLALLNAKFRPLHFRLANQTTANRNVSNAWFDSTSGVPAESAERQVS